MKIKIPLSETNRYIDLMGDPIHRNKIASTVLSPEFAVTVGASIIVGAAIPNDAVIAGLLCLRSNCVGILGSRFVLEKYFLSDLDQGLLLSSAKLKEVCIDKKPSAEQSIESVAKYGSSLLSIRTLYMMGAAFFSAAAVGSLPDSSKALLSTSVLIRNYRGAYRSHKLLSGEWAIVATPDKQEKIKHDWEFELPDIALPSPQPTRDMA